MMMMVIMMIDDDDDNDADANDVKTCRDLDECSIGNPCVEGECHNLEGGYRFNTLLYLSLCWNDPGDHWRARHNDP